MKPLLLSLALGLSFTSFAAQAQMADRLNPVPAIVRPRAATSATEITREMTNRLHLSEAQYIKLLPVNRIRLVRMSNINRQYKSDEPTRLAKLAELEAYYEQECSRILTPSQLSQLQLSQPPSSAPANEGNGLG